MKKLILLCILFLSSTSFCLGIFSLHVNITPSTKKAQEFKVTIKRVENGHIVVRFPWINGDSQSCWLLVFKEGEVPEKDRDFRDIIWYGRDALRYMQDIEKYLAEVAEQEKRKRILHTRKKGLSTKEQSSADVLVRSRKEISDRIKKETNGRFTTDITAVEKVIHLRSDKDGLIEFELKRQLMTRSFVIIDYPYMVMDGGYYYTIDLPEFWKASVRH